MILQYAVASLISQNKTLANTASDYLIPPAVNQEDHVSIGTIVARHDKRIIIKK